MVTELVFVNRSLNPNVRVVSLFWALRDGVMPLCWYSIRACGFLWWHPLRLHAAWGAVACDRFGNRRRLACETVQEGSSEALHIPALADVGGLQALWLTCDGRAAGQVPLSAGQDLTVPLPHALTFCADPGIAPEMPVPPTACPPGTCAVPVRGRAAVTVAMTGGAPGPRSTPITFLDLTPPATPARG